MISDLALWERLQNYDLDAADAAFPFSQRLARDNGWSHRFARNVIEEYKKFVYLICVADQTLTPSDEVDQVWHQHLIYTRDYWGEFCPNVLGRMIHHGPTRGGEAQTRSFKAAYEETLRLYEREFGPPPKAIWPGTEIRFTRPLSFKRIDLSSVYILPKWQVFLCLGGAMTLLLGACKVGSVEVPKAVVSGLPFFIIFAIVFVVIVSSASKKRGKGDGDGGGCGGGSSGCNGNGSWWGSSGHDGGSGCGSDGGSGCGGGCGGGD